MDKNKKEYYLYKSVQDDNILPLTSKCNLSCIFCSHQQNPAEVEVISFGDLSLDKINDLLEYLNPNHPIVIGESATKIIEGEPLLHPDFDDVLALIREKYKDTEIKITTNADLLNKELIEFILNLDNVSLNISVNYLDSKLREKVMGKNCTQNIEKTLKMLSKTDIEYNFSMVALPHLYGYKTIKEEITKMTKYNPLTIRVFMPGYTELTSEKLKFNPSEVYNNLSQLIDVVNQKQKVPVTIEPPQIKDLKTEVKGVIKNSPAEKAKINYLDIIKEINGKKTVTRVNTFNQIKNLKDPELLIKRKNKFFKIQLKKSENERSGLVMDYDITIDRIQELKRVINNNPNKKILFLTSELGYSLIKYVINNYLEQKLENIIVKKIENTYLKGSIVSAGLLTNNDVENFLTKNSSLEFDLLILPSIMYDIFNNDLLGNSYKKLENKHVFEVEII
jgi:molybdenum cofactor biosynthesis enzyme MoaA